MLLPPIHLKGYCRIYLVKKMTYDHLEDADLPLGWYCFQDQEDFYLHFKD